MVPGTRWKKPALLLVASAAGLLLVTLVTRPAWDAPEDDWPSSAPVPVRSGSDRVVAPAEVERRVVETTESVELLSAQGTSAQRALTDEDRIVGQVLDRHGKPSRALVSARPDTDEHGIDSSDHVNVRTDAEGRFSLAIRRDTAILISASWGKGKFSPDLRVEPGQTEVTLQFETPGDVWIDLIGVQPGHSAGVLIPLRWLLVRWDNGREVAGFGETEPFHVKGLQLGKYELYVYLIQDGLYARRTITVGGEGVEYQVPLERREFVAGTLVRPDGSLASGLNVCILETDLPAPVIAAWGFSTTSRDGRFRLMLGPSGRARAVVRTMKKKELGLLDLVAGQGTYVLR